jgi:SAM-dependent methyltransferase
MHYSDRFFPLEGFFVEMGCGTGESSAKLSRAHRTLIGVDYSFVALRAAVQSGSFTAVTQGNILSLPCRSSSIDGIWNLGVMEHFSESQLTACLREFRRVLKPGGVIILFWPPEGNASRWLLGPIERVIGWLSSKPFTFFPDEICRLRSKDQATQLLECNGFQVMAVDFSWRTAFIHMVVVGKCL